VDAGYVLSFSGAVTFRNAPALQAAASVVPLAHLLVETDAPYLTPHPFRGRPNEPYCAVYTVRALADLRAVSEIELASALDANAVRVFGLDRSA
jgi:TatD DNase family protein